MADFEHISGAVPRQIEAVAKPPLDLSHHFSRVTKARQASAIKSFYKYFFIPGIGNLAGGLPCPSYFPYDTLEAQIALPQRFKPTPNSPDDIAERIAKTSLQDPATTSHLVVPHDSKQQNLLRKIDLSTALQYGTAEGYPPLYSILRQFTIENMHPNIPYAGGPEIILTSGSTDGFAKTIEAFTNVWSEGWDEVEEREGVLCEEFAYMNAIQALRPRGLQVIPVKMDGEGLLPSGTGGLEDVLGSWDPANGKRPHLLYTVTIGQNPTSGTLSIERRKAIYTVCSKYDVLIIEDDPYWYLQFPSAAALQAQSRGEILTKAKSPHTFGKSSGYLFLDSLVPSFLSIDTDGRVIRLDTFSKTIAPGCRLGWVTSQPSIIERILRITETTTQQPSGFVQSMVAELILGPQAVKVKAQANQAPFTGWQTDGWVRWLEGLRGNYERHMNIMCSNLDEGRFLLKQGRPRKERNNEWAVISKKEVYTFSWPQGGMFVWIKILYSNHPLFSKVDHQRLAMGLWVFLTTAPFLVLVAPGSIFSPTEKTRDEKGWQFFRLCFAAIEQEEVAQCSKRFADGVKAFWGTKDPKDIDKLLDEKPPTVEERGSGLVDMGAFGGC